MARRALGLAEVQLPSAFLRCRERVQVSRWHPIFGGIILRTERADCSRGLVCSERLTEEFVDLFRGINLEDVLAVYLLEKGGIRPVRELLNEKWRIPSQSGRIRSFRGIRHLIRIDGWLQPLFSKVGNTAIPEIPAQPHLQMRVKIGALRTERSVEITLGLAIAEPARHDPGLWTCERVNL